MLNLWNPGPGLSLPMILATAFFLGMLHGITPDEHTWPITFSYAIGSYSSRRGMRAGFLFSLTFTLQRAIASELAALALIQPLTSPRAGYVIYMVVGAVMVASGAYLRRKGHALHLFHHREGKEPLVAGQPIPLQMALVHGFIAGWGTGAFALILYTVLAPAMPTVWLGFLPGLLFGLGTMITQMLFGAAVGAFMARRRLGPEAMAYVGRFVSSRTLYWGGWVFVLSGILGLFVPLDFAIVTPIRIHNLHHLGVGFVLAVVVLFAVAALSFRRALRDVARLQTG